MTEIKIETDSDVCNALKEELGGYTFAHGRKAKAEEGEAMLAPCLFCGSTNPVASMYGENSLFKVECKNCGALVRGFDQCRQDAIDAWNTRASPAPDAVRTALEPFAAFADALNEDVPDNIAIGFYADGAMRFGPNGGTTVGSLRKARAALRAAPQPSASLLDDQRNWTEDASHENGNYECRCCECNQMFTGHKRRVLCKACSRLLAPAPQPLSNPLGLGMRGALEALMKIAHYSPASTIQPVAIARDALIKIIGTWQQGALDSLPAEGGAREGWQPIETAPKDGTEIMVWPYWSDRLPAQVHWRDLKRKPGRWEITPSFYCAGAAPTLWQPLPAPPVSRPKSGGEA